MTEGKPLKIAVASGKGGTGKTLLSTNLAAYIGQTRKVLLMDLDVEEPDDFIFIGGRMTDQTDQYKMIPEWDAGKCTLCGECTANCRYHAVIQLGDFIAVFKELCHGCYACSELCPENALPMRKHKMGEFRYFENGKLTFLEGRLLPGEEQAVPLIRQAHQLADERHDDIPIHIYDCPPGTSCPMVAALKDVSYVILVTEPTPFGLHDLKLSVETVRNAGLPPGVVINRDGIGNDEVADFCMQEKIPVLARIPFSREIATRYSRGELVFDHVAEMSGALSRITLLLEETL